MNTNTDTIIDYQLRVGNSYAKAGALVASNRIVAGNDSGYNMITAGESFDIRYPILYSIKGASGGGILSSTFYNYSGIAIATETLNGGAKGTFEANKPLYLVGTLNNNIFTVDSNSPLTTTIPTSKDNKVYIEIGATYSTSMFDFACSNKMYSYINGAFIPISASVGGDKEAVVSEIVKLIPESSAEAASNESKIFQWSGNSVTI